MNTRPELARSIAHIAMYPGVKAMTMPLNRINIRFPALVRNGLPQDQRQPRSGDEYP
jgi:hypothetical protein